MRSKLLHVVIILLINIAAVLALNNTSSSSHGLAMFIFGDSLADVGNNNYLPFSTLKANFFPNGIDFQGRKATGRFNNGRLVLDIIAARLGFAVPLPYLASTTKGLALLQGVNYASAGCGILNDTSNNSSGCLSFSTQIKYHTNTVERITQQLGANQTQDFLTESLYFILIGSNDFLGNYIKRNTGASSVQQFIGLLSSSLTKELASLYDQYARRMVLIGLGPLGCIPSQRARTSNGGCSEDINSWAVSLNDAMRAVVNQLGTQYPDAKITFANPYDIIEAFIQNPSVYGFNVTSEACCGGGRMNAQVPCLPLFICCSNRSNHLFWDPWHPSEAANTLIADMFLSPNSTFATPWTIAQVAS